MTAETKNLSNNGSVNSLVSNLLHFQDGKAIAVVRQGQFSRAQLKSLPGRVFSPKASANKVMHSVTIIEKTPTGYILLLHATNFNLNQALTPR